MAKARVVCLATVLLAPAVLATPIFYFGSGWLDYSWSVPGASGTCRDPFYITAQEVRLKLLATIQGGTRGASVTLNPIQPYCPLLIEAAPGVYPNPCDALGGHVPSAPVGPIDPFLHGTPYKFSKRIDFQNGGFVVYNVAKPIGEVANYHEFWGSCYSPPSAHASWNGAGQPHAKL